MHDQAQQQNLRPFTDAELGAVVKAYRDMRKWSQEQLAEIARLTPRTVQRVERGEGCSLDTKRAIAGAFEFEDLDILSKPLHIPSNEEVAAARKRFDADHVTLEASPMETGKQLVAAVTASVMDLSTSSYDMGDAAHVAFAALIDEFRDFRDVVDIGACSEVDKVQAAQNFQLRLDELSRLGVTLRYALRELSLEPLPGSNGRALAATGLYLVAFPKGNAPKTFCVARKVSLGM